MPEETLLVADVGGTHSRFALAAGAGGWPRLRCHREFANDGVADIAAQLRRYLEQLPAGPRPAACLAVAGPVTGDCARLTNRPWRIDGPALAAEFGLPRATVVNDFAALAAAVAFLPGAARQTLQAGKPVYGAPLAVVGPGTGLGAALVVNPGPDQTVLATEGGHVDFAASSERDWALREGLSRELGRAVSAEDVLRGDGLARLYRELGGDALDPARVSAARAVDARAGAAVDWYLSLLGRFAGDTVLASGATGGLFLGGGVLPRLAAALPASPFLDSLADKGVMSDVVRRAPVHLVTDARAALAGAFFAGRGGHI